MLIVGQKTINLTEAFCASSDWANLYGAATVRPVSQMVRWGEIRQPNQCGASLRLVCFPFLSLEIINERLLTVNVMILRPGMHGLESPGLYYICESQCHHLPLPRCSEKQNRRRSNSRQSGLDILDLHWTERWNPYFSTEWYLMSTSLSLTNFDWKFLIFPCSPTIHISQVSSENIRKNIVILDFRDHKIRGIR